MFLHVGKTAQLQSALENRQTNSAQMIQRLMVFLYFLTACRWWIYETLARIDGIEDSTSQVATMTLTYILDSLFIFIPPGDFTTRSLDLWIFIARAIIPPILVWTNYVSFLLFIPGSENILSQYFVLHISPISILRLTWPFMWWKISYMPESFSVSLIALVFNILSKIWIWRYGCLPTAVTENNLPHF